MECGFDIDSEILGGGCFGQGTIAVGAFDDQIVLQVESMPDGETSIEVTVARDQARELARKILEVLAVDDDLDDDEELSDD